MNAQSMLAVKTIRVDTEGHFRCDDTGHNINSEIADYSCFKFGDVESIMRIGDMTSQFVIDRLEEGGELLDIFTRAKKQREFIYIQAPGIRNVASSSNHLMSYVAEQVNVWLAINGYPTMIKKPIVRLASGIANYAELSGQQRKTRAKTTTSLYPVSDYKSYPINVIFIDDVKVSGSTLDRAKEHCLGAGALSFSSVFAYQVDQCMADTQASIEHKMNQFQISGSLDAEIARILGHKEYMPVQRMLRLILHKRNRNELDEFLRSHVPEKSMLKIYMAALSNDYHSILIDGELAYEPSLKVLRSLLVAKKLIA